MRALPLLIIFMFISAAAVSDYLNWTAADMITAFLLWIAAPFLIIEKFHSPALKAWTHNISNIGSHTLYLFGVPALFALALWYLTGENSKNHDMGYGQSSAWIKFCILYFILFPSGSLTLLIMDKIFHRFGKPSSETVRRPSHLPDTNSSIDNDELNYDPARFGKK